VSRASSARAPAAGQPAGIVAQCLRDFAALEALAPEWSALWERSPAATPVQSPLWLLPWWRHLGGGALIALALRQGGRLVALAPLFRPSGGTPLLPLGIGISDYLDVLLDPDAVSASALLDHLVALARAGEAIELHELPPSSPLVGAPPPRGWRSEMSQQSACPGLSLPRGGDLRHCLPRKAFRDWRQAQRRCAAAGEVAIETADAQTCETLFTALTRLHARRWCERGEAGVLADPAVQRFHRAALPGFAAAGLLRLYALRIAGRIVAVYYGMAAKGRHYAYLSGFDPDFERHSVGCCVTVSTTTRLRIREPSGSLPAVRSSTASRGSSRKPASLSIRWAPPSCSPPSPTRPSRGAIASAK